MAVVDVDSILDNLEKQILGDKPELTLEEITAKDIPNFVKNYVDREAEKWIREESSMFLSSGRFDYELPEVRQKFDELYGLIKKTAKFKKVRLSRILEQSIKLQMNFLLTPQRTMLQFIYRDAEVITAAEVKDSMKYFVDYSYYNQAVDQYFKLKEIDVISRNKFQNFIKQVDEKAFSQARVETAVNVARAIVNFLNIGRAQNETIDTKLLLNAYKDRNLEDFAQAIGQAQDKKLQEIALSALEKMLQSFVDTGSIEEKVEEAKKETAAVETKSEAFTYEEDKKVVESEQLDTLLSQIDNFQEIEEEEEMLSLDELLTEEEDDDTGEEEPAPVAEKPKPKPVPAQAQEAAQEKSGIGDAMADHIQKSIAAEGPLQDLHTMIEPKQRKVFIKKLFKKDQEKYDAFLNALNEMSGWKDASTFVDDGYYEHDINPYAKEAITLSDIIYNRFCPKDEYV